MGSHICCAGNRVVKDPEDGLMAMFKPQRNSVCFHFKDVLEILGCPTEEYEKYKIEKIYVN